MTANQIMEKLVSRGNFAKTKMDAIKANSGRYKIEDAGINSPYSDYGTTIYANKIVFASARDTKLAHRRHTWTGQPFTKLYVADVGEEMSLGSPAKFDKSINSKFNESTPVLLKMVNNLFHKKQLSREEEEKTGMTVR
jgi:hypothetical protein